VDASIAVKQFIREVDSENALAWHVGAILVTADAHFADR
jgi:predicted nucleic acid-binding protein